VFTLQIDGSDIHVRVAFLDCCSRSRFGSSDIMGHGETDRSTATYGGRVALGKHNDTFSSSTACQAVVKHTALGHRPHLAEERSGKIWEGHRDKCVRQFERVSETPS